MPYTAIPILQNRINAIGKVLNQASASNLGVTWTDITNVTFSFTITKTCTVLYFFNCALKNDTAWEWCAAQILRGATVVGKAQIVKNDAGSANIEQTISIMGLETGLAPGTYTIKAQYRASSVGSTVSMVYSDNINSNGLYAIAFEE